MFDLYILETCPYSKKVMEYLDEHKISYNKKDVKEPQNYEALLEIGGKGQVPFLVDTDKNTNLFDSDEIIDYIKDNV